MFKSLTAILSTALLLSACGSTTDPIEESHLTRDKAITVGSATRTYHLYLPDRPESAAIVFLLHGHGGSADQILGLEGTKAPFKVWTDIALRENLILVVPDGELGSDDKKGWNDCRTDARTNPPTDDMRFLTSLLDRVVADYSSGTPKVYINGISNGGFMAQRLADEVPERLDAVAVIVTSRPGNSGCPVATQPLPILFMNGTDDPILPYDGGNIVDNRGAVTSTPATIEHWVNRNQTDSTPVQTSIANLDTEDGSTIQRYSYLNGANGSVVEHYEIVGGGHTEPSLQERYANIYKLFAGSQNGDIEMADEVWKFFATH